MWRCLGAKKSSQSSNKNIQWLKTWSGHDVLYFQRCVLTRSGFVSRLQKKDVFLPSPKKEIAKISDAFLRWSVLIHSGCFTRLSFFSMCFGWLCWWHTLEKSWFRRNHHHVKRCNIESIESGFLFGSLEIIRWKCQQKHTFYQKTSTSHQLRAYPKHPPYPQGTKGFRHWMLNQIMTYI